MQGNNTHENVFSATYSEVFHSGSPRKAYVKYPNTVIRNPEISAAAKVIWGCMASYEDGWLTSMDMVGKDAGFSRNTVRRAIRELEDVGLIESTPKVSGGKTVAYRYVVNYVID